MSDGPVIGEISWERMIRAVENVKGRLHRAVRGLEAAGIPYAVAEGNADAVWVSRVDEAAVRNTRDVDILLNRQDLPRAIQALEQAGFVYRHAMSIDMFLDGPGASAGDAAHVLFANEKVRDEYVSPAPTLDETDATGPFVTLSLDALVRMKLTSFRDKDRTHLRDMIDVGLIDSSWPARFPKELAVRLQELLDNPEG